MAHFTRVRGSGFWTVGSTFLSTEAEAFDSRLVKAVNGDDGGTWAPPSPITIGGLGGLTVSGPFLSTGSFNVDGVANLNLGAVITGGNLSVALNATVQGNLEAQGTTHLVGNVTADNDIRCERLNIRTAAIGSNVLSVDGDGELTGALTVGDNLEVSGATACNDALGVVGTFTALGSSIFAGTVSITKAVTATGEGRVRKRYLGLSDADATISINDCDIAFAASGVLTAARTLVVTTTGAAAGDTLTITNDNSFLLTVRLGSMVGSILTSLVDTSGSNRSAVLVFDGSTWQVLHEIPVA